MFVVEAPDPEGVGGGENQLWEGNCRREAKPLSKVVLCSRVREAPYLRLPYQTWNVGT